MGFSTHKVLKLPKDIESFEVVSASSLELFDPSEWRKPLEIQKDDDRERYFIRFAFGEFAEVAK